MKAAPAAALPINAVCSALRTGCVPVKRLLASSIVRSQPGLLRPLIRAVDNLSDNFPEFRPQAHSAPALSVPHKSILIDVLDVDLRGLHFQQSERMNASIIGISRLLAFVKPFDVIRLALRRVIWEASIAKANSLDSHECFIGNAEMFMSPHPAIDLSLIQKRLNLRL